jgi:hypothetical protein
MLENMAAWYKVHNSELLSQMAGFPRLKLEVMRDLQREMGSSIDTDMMEALQGDPITPSQSMF